MSFNTRFTVVLLRVAPLTFESIKLIEDSKYDKIFVDLNDDQYCIDLARKNMKSLKIFD